MGIVDYLRLDVDNDLLAFEHVREFGETVVVSRADRRHTSGRQIVMVQNSLHMPVRARSAFYDKVRSLRVRSKKRAH